MSTPPDHIVKQVDEDIRSEFERIWGEVTTTPIPEYRVLIWGSVVDDRDRDPVDLDLIFEYYTTPIKDDKEDSIESWLQRSVHVSEFSYVDPLVTHHLKTPDIIAQSRTSQVFSIDDDSWLGFD